MKVFAALCLLTYAATVCGQNLTCASGAGITTAKEPQCCCPASCGECGGANCQNRPGGEDSCCCGGIFAAGIPCDSDHEPPCIVQASKVNPKRGFVADDKVSCDTPLLLNVSGWYYDYNVNNNYRTPGLSGNCALQNATDSPKFAPMNWCLDGMNASIPDYVNRTFFMGYNEPNNLHNCNTDAETAAKGWGEVMKKWPDSLLVSPATAGNGIPWFDEFFGNCTKLYGPSGCNISYLAAHDYSCTPSHTLSYLKSLYDRYGYKVWLTEFSCGDGADGKPTKDHLSFMAEVLPLLDAADFVYRYSWMSAHDRSGRRGLVNVTSDGGVVLTNVGVLYNS